MKTVYFVNEYYNLPSGDRSFMETVGMFRDEKTAEKCRKRYRDKYTYRYSVCPVETDLFDE